MSYLEGKRVLFVGIGFYDYETVLCDVMRKEGASVDSISSTSESIASRLLRRIKLANVANNLEDNTRHEKINSLSNQYDIVFIIKGENLNSRDINLLKERNPKARFVLYLWDSLVRHNNIELLLENFAEVWSFDRVDCNENKNIRFRPLFYRKKPILHDKIYYLSFIGWMHSDRLKILRSLRDQLVDLNKTYYLKLYMGLFSYLVARYISRRIKKSDDELITLKPIPYSEFQYITAASDMVLDVAHPLQSGLTIRTIETLAANCHLLTTNSDILNYVNIYKSKYTVFDREKPFLPMNVICNENIGDYFSIEQFVREILCCKK